MAHYARVTGGKVTKVIVAEPEVLVDLVEDTAGEWIQTSYNTYGGQHLLGGTPLRMNYAGVGYTYDPIKDAFIPPQPFASWTLNEDTCLWEAPVAMPDDSSAYKWDEDSLSWELLAQV